MGFVVVAAVVIVEGTRRGINPRKRTVIALVEENRALSVLMVFLVLPSRISKTYMFPPITLAWQYVGNIYRSGHWLSYFYGQAIMTVPPHTRGSVKDPKDTWRLIHRAC